MRAFENQPYRWVSGADKGRGAGLSLTPDVETVSDDYAWRFAGPVGDFLLQVQGDYFARLAGSVSGRRALEVGGGHGRLTRRLLDAGFAVTVQGSTADCDRRIRPWMAEFPDRLDFVESSLWDLPFAHREVDLVVGIRPLAHVEDWSGLLAEMARVCRDQLILGYTPTSGFNRLAPMFYGLKQRIEGNTRPYAAYDIEFLIDRLGGLGFVDFAVEKQFTMPLAVHRGIRSRPFSKAAEGAARALGLTRLVGAPALLSARRGAAT